MRFLLFAHRHPLVTGYSVMQITHLSNTLAELEPGAAG